MALEKYTRERTACNISKHPERFSESSADEYKLMRVQGKEQVLRNNGAEIIYSDHQRSTKETVLRKTMRL